MSMRIEELKLMENIKRQKHKFGAVRCERDSIKFPSKLERSLYDKLKLMQQNNLIIGFLRQPVFDLPGGAKYYADFQVFWNNGTVSFIDTKGKDTPMSILKRKIVEAEYPWITIEIVTKV